jgi:hypothetical protein
MNDELPTIGHAGGLASAPDTHPAPALVDMAGEQAGRLCALSNSAQLVKCSGAVIPFNRRYGVECFPLPEPQILGEATRDVAARRHQ